MGQLLADQMLPRILWPCSFVIVNENKFSIEAEHHMYVNTDQVVTDIIPTAAWRDKHPIDRAYIQSP
jgi:hypothetical protein